MSHRLACPGLVALGLLWAAGQGAVRTAEAPPEGRAAGTFTVDGKSVSLAHAYAQMEKDSEGKEEVIVLLTDKPLAPDVLREQPLSDAMYAAAGALKFRVDGAGKASGWFWIHPDLSMGCGYCSELQVQGFKRSATAVQGTALSTAPGNWKKQTYQFNVAFNARFQPPPVPAKP